MPYSLEMVDKAITGRGQFAASSKAGVNAAVAVAERLAKDDGLPLPRLLTCTLGNLRHLVAHGGD